MSECHFENQVDLMVAAPTPHEEATQIAQVCCLISELVMLTDH